VNRPTSILAPVFVLLLLAPAISRSQTPDAAFVPADAASTLARVTFVTETQGTPGHFVFDGRLISDYRPKIYRVYPTTGVVLDERGHVLSFLGYRWVDLQGTEPRIEVSTVGGEKSPGRLIGIDQSLGVAVVRSEGRQVKVTPLCTKCEIRPDETVFVPVLDKMGAAEYQTVRIVDIGTVPGMGSAGMWRINLSRPLDETGKPLLNSARQVLGYIANGELFYPISQLLTSAEKVLQAGGDIRTGWLGIYVEMQQEPSLPAVAGVKIKDVERESPAEKSGLIAGDLLRSWNGRKIGDARNFIRMVQNTPIGSQVSFEILRNGKALVLSALIEARKPRSMQERFVFSFPEGSLAEGSGAAGGFGATPQALWGIDTIALTPKLAEVFRIPIRSGLLVSDIRLQQAFDQAGVEVGDVILQADGRPVTDPGAFYTLIHSLGPGAQVTLKLYRKGAERLTTIRIPAPPPAPRP